MFRYRTNTPINDYDPTIALKSKSTFYTDTVYESLLSFKAGPEVDYYQLIIEPKLAERWEVSPDGRQFTFHLRRGVKFASIPPVEGRELNSSDVAFSLQYSARTGEFRTAKLPPPQFNQLLEGLEEVATPDPYTAVVKFKDPFIPFLNYAASQNLPMLPREIYDQNGSLSTRMAGTGPWQFDEGASQKDVRWVFKRNPGYWQQGQPYMDEIRAIHIADDSANQAAFQTKQTDVIEAITVPDIENIRKSNPQAMVNEILGPPVHLYPNVTKPPFNDVRVRRAWSLAMDRDELIRVFSQGKGRWALAGALWDTFTDEETRRILKYDPEEAKRLLAEAGYAGGLDVEQIYPGTAYGELYVSTLQLIQAQMRKVGINVKLTAIDLSEITLRRRSGDFIIQGQSKAIETDVDSYVYSVFHPRSSSNFGRVDDPKLTPLLEAQRQEPDPVKRRELVRQAVHYANEQAYGIPWFYRVEAVFWEPALKNYKPHFGYRGEPIQNAWLDR